MTGITTFLVIMLGIIVASAAIFGAGSLMFAMADRRERQRFGVPLTPARGEQVGRRVGATFAVIVFISSVVWFEVGGQVFASAIVAGLAYQFCYAPIAGSAKGRAERLKGDDG
jgi:hypothetical protein